MAPERLIEARRRLDQALTMDSWTALSNVLYDAGNDGLERPDGEGGWTTDEYGYDCDELAVVLWSFLKGDQRPSEEWKLVKDDASHWYYVRADGEQS